ncbi:MAG TPA: YCF48-related protein [Thermoanaerobaculia bacterium]|jgi:photosystem II stability/assembly factor-like uncharacterized protein
MVEPGLLTARCSFVRLAVAALLGALASASRLPAQDGAWSVAGPPGGTAYCLSEDSSSDLLYAGTDDGVLVGRRDGESWTKANGGIAGIAGLRIQSLAIDPAHPQTLYAGTVTPAGTPSVGIFKSEDAGGHWTSISDGLIDPTTGAEPLDVSAIAIDPTNPSVLVIGTRFSEIFRSIDGGATWTPQTSSGFVQGLVTEALSFDPFDATLVYAATNLGFAVSTDGGLSWAFAGDALVGFTDLVADPSTQGVLYAANPVGGGVYKSTDAGAHWTASNEGLSVAGAIAAVGVVAVDPNDPRVVIAGTAGQGIFVSLDGAGTWAPAGSGPVVAVVDSVAFSRTTSTALVGTHGDGVFRSTDLGSTWSPSSAGFDASLISALVADPQTAGRAVAGAYDGIHLTSDGGLDWTAAPSGPTAPVSSLAFGAEGMLLAGTIGGGVLASKDGGSSWTTSAGGLTDADIGAVAVDPSDSRTVYAGTAHPFDGTNSERVFKSTDGGATWTQTSLDAQDATIFAITVNPSKPAQVAAVSPGTIVYFQSNDGGGSWSTITPNPSCGSVNAVFYDDPGGAVLVGAAGGICRSTDSGNTWTAIPVAPLASVTTFFADPSTGTGTIYAGAEPLVPGGTGGVFRSTDAGATWTAVGSGLEAESVHAIARDASGGRLYAGLFGGGVATLSLSPSSRSPIESVAPPGAPRQPSR